MNGVWCGRWPRSPGRSKKNSYRPLSRIVPRPAAILTTFVVCGFLLHDLPAWAFARRALPPGATIAFVMFDIGAIVGERLRMDTSRLPLGSRAGINVAYLAGCTTAMLLIIRRL